MRVINKIIFSIIFLVVGLCFGQKIEIITTTSQISSIAKEIGQSKVNITFLIPPAICPGHYEIKPSDIKKLYQDGILLYHGWEGFIDDIKNAVPDSKAKIHCINIPGSWLIPDVQIKVAEKIMQILSTIDPSNKNFYLTNLEFYTKKMFILDKEIKNIVSTCKLSEVPVICSKMQKDLLDYLGFKVIECFGRDEELTPKKLMQIINQAKIYGVRLIVSNLQSGTSVGEMLSKRTKIPHAVLSNFPDGFEDTETIEKTIIANLYILKNAVKLKR